MDLDEIDGRSLMKQSLLSKCVHKVVQEENIGNPEEILRKTLTYLYNFRKSCTDDSSKLDNFVCAEHEM